MHRAFLDGLIRVLLSSYVCALAACDGKSVAPAPAVLPALGSMQVERSLLDLVVQGKREVLTEVESAPIRVNSIVPNPVSRIDSGVMRALEMVPPAAIRIEVPATEPSAALHIAAGIDETAIGGPAGKVRFVVELDGVALFDETMGSGPGLPKEERAWRRAVLPMSHGGTLVLRTSWDGPPDQAPRAGFGSLDLRATRQIPRTAASPEHPNVLVILVDTLRADALSCYGFPEEVSPVADALAARGTLFERAISAAPWTWPATASIFTGLGAAEHGVTDRHSCHLAEQFVTLSEAMQDGGLSTAAVVTNPLITAQRNFDQGFEKWWEEKWANGTRAVDEALRVLVENRERRFYLYVHLSDPHHPYDPDPDFRERYASSVPLDYDDQELRALWQSYQVGKPCDVDRMLELGRQASLLYRAEVATSDRAIGRLLKRLDELGLTENTVIALTADHGEEFFEHDMLAHANQFHDESLRVPLILAGPGVPRGKRVADAVESRLLAPTVLALAGLEATHNLDQPSLLDPASKRAGTPIYFGTELGLWPGLGPRALHGLELDGLRLTWAPAVDEEPELLSLYDLKSDPAATKELADQRRAEVEKLRTLLSNWVTRGESIRPQGIAADADTTEMLRDIGYIGEEE